MQSPYKTVAAREGARALNPHPLRQGGSSMNTVTSLNQRAQLIKRRAEIALTLRHVKLEQQDVEAKEASMDRDARASRLTLLRDLNDWFSREIDQVEQELRRVGVKEL
jgi:hypothetical protein